MEQGMDGLQAAKEVVGQNGIPLAGATAVAILAFASMGGMTNNTAVQSPSHDQSPCRRSQRSAI